MLTTAEQHAQHQQRQADHLAADATALGMRIVYVDENGDEAQASPVEDLPTFWLWPDALPVWMLWLGLRTQWRVGMGGATGLDYTAVLADLREQIPDDAPERRQTYLDIKAMEAVTLQEWADQRPPPPASK